MPTETQQDREQSLRTELAVVKTAGITITSQQTYDQAVTALETTKSWRRSWKSYWYGSEDNPGPVALAHSSWKSLLGKFNDGDEPADKVEKALKANILKWDDDQRREQERLQAEAQRKAEEEAEALRAQQAVEMEAEGATDEEIEALVTAPVLAVAAPVAPSYQKASGISKRDNWCIEITDLKAVLKAIGSGKLKLSAEDCSELRAFIELLLKPRAVSDKQTLNIAGCKAVNRPIIASRGGR
jgi:acyl transferase domain-containing protein